jgi:hypothetical protein
LLVLAVRAKILLKELCLSSMMIFIFYFLFFPTRTSLMSYCAGVG